MGEKRHPTTNKKWRDRKKARKNRLVEAGISIRQKQNNKANKAQFGEQNNNQPDRNGIDLPCLAN
jgi:hypothetical protein